MPSITELTKLFSKGKREVKLRIVERHVLDSDSKIVLKYFIQTDLMNEIHGLTYAMVTGRSDESEMWTDITITEYPKGISDLSTAEFLIKQMFTKDKVIKEYKSNDFSDE